MFGLRIQSVSGRARRHRLMRYGAAMITIAAGSVYAAPTSLHVSAAGSSVPSTRHIVNVSHACAGQNAEVEQAVDPKLGYVYELWMGCRGIGFARSTDGGGHFEAPMHVPGAEPASWDPAVAVAPDGTVYVAYMVSRHHFTYPVVAASRDHGVSFRQVVGLVPPAPKNWGDREFIAVDPHGVVYVTWDYGPSSAAVTYICNPHGSCAFATGDLNVVMQRSSDGGRTWSPIIHVSPGFPASGGDSAPMVIEPSGRIDLEYQGYHITNDVTYTMTPAHSYFTSSTDGGATWSPPVQIGPRGLTMSKAEWWIDGAIGMDAAGNLYTTWDTQGSAGDIGWLSYSTDHGATWSPLIRVTPDTDRATHIVEVVGGTAGVAYVGWLADSSPHGYAQYLRPFSITQGWLSGVVQVSTQFGSRLIWPGDTFGLSVLSVNETTSGAADQHVIVSWGSATSHKANADSEIFAAVVQNR